MTHDEDEDDEDDGFQYDGFRGDPQDPFDSTWRFGFSFGPDGMRIQEPPVFGHVLREMEEIFSQLGRWEGKPESGYFGILISLLFAILNDNFNIGRSVLLKQLLKVFISTSSSLTQDSARK